MKRDGGKLLLGLKERREGSCPSILGAGAVAVKTAYKNGGGEKRNEKQ